MKKLMLGASLIVVLVLAVAVFAGDVTQVSSWNMADGKRNTALKDLVVTDVPALVTEVNRINGLADAAVDGTGLSVQITNVTMHTGTIWTQTFSTVFSATPMVVATYTEDPGDVRPLFVTSATPSNVLVNATADKNFNLVIVGTK